MKKQRKDGGKQSETETDVLLCPPSGTEALQLGMTNRFPKICLKTGSTFPLHFTEGRCYVWQGRGPLLTAVQIFQRIMYVCVRSFRHQHLYKISTSHLGGPMKNSTPGP
ncbi:hypothetical protein JOQ06_003325, partial [Pogonophryne albipinna]